MRRPPTGPRMNNDSTRRLAARAGLAVFSAIGFAAFAADEPPASPMPQVSASRAGHPPAAGHKLDTSGRRQVGKASFYARKFAGRKMADGTPMNPRDDNAASKTLPL